jgi:hypothetical protein
LAFPFNNVPTAVIKAMLEIKRDMEQGAKRAETLGLAEEELAFYDANRRHTSRYLRLARRDRLPLLPECAKRFSDAQTPPKSNRVVS